MLLQHIMLFWALLALLVVILAAAGLLTRNQKSEGTEEPSKALFDFSAGQEEGRQMQKVLTEALASSNTDAEFEHNFKRLAGTDTGLDAAISWSWLGRFLMEYRQADEFEASPRALAMRFLQDIPHRYHLKDVPREPERPAV